MQILPVTPTSWPWFERLFLARGAPGYCWCTPYRFRNAHELERPAMQAAMRGLVGSGVPIGVIALDGDEPVGWCSVAPRETHQKLERSRTMPRVSDEPTWTVLCFFVPRAQRGRGITRALLEGAVAYAREQGAVVVEGYPWDSAGISSTHRGHSAVFAACGFVRDGERRWVAPAQLAVETARLDS